MTIVASFTLAFLLFLILGFRSFTHPLIYVTAGILIAMGGWHIQTLIRTLLLKTQWKRRMPLSDDSMAFKSATTGKLLDQANFTGAIPTSITEHTTRHLSATRREEN